MMLTNLVHFFIIAFNSLSVLVLLVGVTKAMFRFFTNEISFVRTDRSNLDVAQTNNLIKRDLGTYVLLSLEVLIAADIVESIINPTVEDILMLGAVVVIRTVISYFLGKEIEAIDVD